MPEVRLPAPVDCDTIWVESKLENHHPLSITLYVCPPSHGRYPAHACDQDHPTESK